VHIYDRFEELFTPSAGEMRVQEVCIGLGYTVVALRGPEDPTGSTRSIGVAFTYLDGKDSCTLVEDQRDYDTLPVTELLAKLRSDNLVERSVAVATVNALNHERSQGFAEDAGSLLDDLAVGPGDTVAMVGYFSPVARQIESRGAAVRAYDIGKGIGEHREFYAFLGKGDAKGLIVTSTSIVGGSTEEVLRDLPAGLRVALLGPTTPLVPEAYTHLPVHYLGGTLPVDAEGVIKAARQGKGTKALHRASKKIYHRIGRDPLPALR